MATKKRIKAVGYARRSTDMQERSIPDQKAYVEKWAAENGYRILRWYIDDAISGTSTKGRVAFEQLIAAAENGKDFDTILCYDISRFSRGGTNETGYYLHRLQLVGVDAIFPADGITEGDEGELLQGVKSWQAKQYTVKLSKDVIRGQISYVMKQNSTPGGLPPYGYDRQHLTSDGKILRTFRCLSDGRREEYGPDGKMIRILESNDMVRKAKSDIVRLVPSTPDRVRTVKRIFQLAVRGYGSQHISARLNEDGIPSFKGNTWTSNQVRNMLRNPAYRGAIAWNKRTTGKINGVDGNGNLRPKKRQYQQANDKSDWYVVENVHEPLVSTEDFEKVQHLIDKRRLAGGAGKTTGRVLLAGLVKCSRCGYAYLKKHSTYKYKGECRRRYYYTDGGNVKGGKSVCKPISIRMEMLDMWVMKQIKHVLLGDHDTVKQGIDAFVKQVSVSREMSDDIKSMKKELDAINRRIKATIAMLADPAFDGLDELKSTLMEMKSRRDGLQKKLESSDRKNVVTFRESELRKWATEQLLQIEEFVVKPTPTIEARNLVSAYVDRIELDTFTREGVLYLAKDAYECFKNSFCSWGNHGTTRWMPQDAVLLLDSSRVKVLPLSGRSFHFKPLASGGDYECGELIGEYTLELRNQAAHGVIRGLATS